MRGALAEQPGRFPQEVHLLAVEKCIALSSLARVMDRMLDKSVVIDAFLRVALVGAALLAIRPRVVHASVEAWLKSARSPPFRADARPLRLRREGARRLLYRPGGVWRRCVFWTRA